MTKKYRVGVVGCGNIFPMHAISVNDMENTELAAVCDIKPDRAKTNAGYFGCKYYTDYKEMLDKENLDVLHICLPHYLHASVAIDAMNRGISVLTEKPMTIHLEDAEKMVQTAKDNNVTLGVIFQNHYNPGSILIKDTLDSGKLGKIKSGKLSVTWDRSDEYYSHSDWKGTWEKEGGGVIIDQAIHTMDLMRWFMDSEIEYVDANISNRAHQIIEVEDAAEGIIKFKNGAVAAFHTINYYTYDAAVEIELHCENGIAKMISDKGIVKFNDGSEMSADKNPNEIFEYVDGVKEYWGVSHIKQIRAFYDSLEKRQKPVIDGEYGLETQKMICAIYESGKKKQRVVL